VTECDSSPCKAEPSAAVLGRPFRALGDFADADPGRCPGLELNRAFGAQPGRPMVNTGTVSKELKISQVAADKLLKSFVEAGILKEVTGFKRNRMFQFEAYFDLFLK
jgi:hypothetical protein